MTNRLVRLALILSLLLLPAVVGAQTKIVVWDSLSATGRAVYNEVLDEFRAEFPHIEVESIYQSGYYEAMEKITISYAAGLVPNVVMMEQSIAFALIDNGMAASLTPYMADDSEVSVDDFFPNMLATLKVGDDIYGVPYNVSTPLLYYNADLFQQSGLDPVAPQGKDGYLSTARHLTRYNADNEIDVYGFWLTRWRWLFEAWVGRSGSRIMNEDRTEFTFNTPEVVDTLEFARELVHQHRVAGYSAAAASAHTPFLQGRLGMFEYTTAGLASMIERSDAAGIDLRVAPLPAFEEAYVPIGGANFMMIDSGTQEQKDAAWEFLKFIIRPENQVRFAVATGYMVSRRSALETDMWRDFVLADPRAQVTYMQVENAYPRPRVAFWDEIQQQVRDRLSDVMYTQQGNIKNELDEIVRLANMRLQSWGQ